MDHDFYQDTYLADILNTVRSVAMVGASPNHARPSFRVLSNLISLGYDVFPINPGHAGQLISGAEVFASLADLTVPVDMVDIFRAPEAIPLLTEEILQMKELPKVVWMQLGIRNDLSALQLEKNGVKVVMNRCPSIEIQRLEALIR